MMNCLIVSILSYLVVILCQNAAAQFGPFKPGLEGGLLPNGHVINDMVGSIPNLPLQKFSDVAQETMDSALKMTNQTGFGDFVDWARQNPLATFADFAKKHGFPDFAETFRDFVTRFEKRYTEAEKLARQLVLLQSLQLIKQFNARNDTWQQGVNPLADLSQEEYLQRLVDLPPLNETESETEVESRNETGSDNLTRVKRQSLPSHFDWRERGMVTPVEDQGQCNSCWSFSVASAISSAYAIKYGRQHLQPLSKQQLVECFHDQGCSVGAWPEKVYPYIVDNLRGKIATENSYPYNYQQINSAQCHRTRDHGAQITGSTRLPKGTSDQKIRETLKNHGPLSVVLNFDAFRLYRAGVVFTGHCTERSTHAVTLVGWGTQNGQDYWLVKNSYGPSWGEDGYIKIGRHDNVCSINNYITYPTV